MPSIVLLMEDIGVAQVHQLLEAAERIDPDGSIKLWAYDDASLDMSIAEACFEAFRAEREARGN